ncbi:MAG: hypothetical protein IPG69_12625 [Flavobacteriales bacterium]|nr:hypothetical protein [Flavobacteriales bacterium]MBK9076363.1 hypothetical protein [Flavobacteriales bacterium]
MSTAGTSTELPLSLPLPVGAVQKEWDQTIARMHAACEVLYATAQVDLRRYPTIEVRNTPDLPLAELERILFENLLLAPLHRLEYSRTILFKCEWLWTWRKTVPWKLDGSGSIMRLAPDTPKALWTYRYNVVEVG